MDDFEFFHRKKFLNLTLNTVATHNSMVRYQASSDKEDLVTEHTDHEFRHGTSQGPFFSLLLSYFILGSDATWEQKTVKYRTNEGQSIKKSQKSVPRISINTGLKPQTRNILESDSEDPQSMRGFINLKT